MIPTGLPRPWRSLSSSTVDLQGDRSGMHAAILLSLNAFCSPPASHGSRHAKASNPQAPCLSHAFTSLGLPARRGGLGWHGVLAVQYRQPDDSRAGSSEGQTLRMDTAGSGGVEHHHAKPFWGELHHRQLAGRSDARMLGNKAAIALAIRLARSVLRPLGAEVASGRPGRCA